MASAALLVFVVFLVGIAISTPILAVPLFILGGVIMAEGGIPKKLFPPAENYKISSAFSYKFKSALTVLIKGAASADAKVYSPIK